MRFSVRHRRLVSLLATFVLLLGAIAPAISAMTLPPRAHGLLEICTVEGTVRVAAPEGFGEPEPVRSAGHGFEHCPFCGSHSPILHAPAADSAVLHIPGLSEARPPAFLFAPRTIHAWTSAQPRAPPSFS